MQLQLASLLVLSFSGPVLVAQDQQVISSAQTLLKQADRMMSQGDRYRAAPMYTKAQLLFESARDERGKTEAKLGQLRASTDQGDYPSLREQAEMLLESRIVQNDSLLKIKALALIGLIDLNIDTAAAMDDYSALLAQAVAVGDLKWENRARGELAILAGINGKVAEAGRGLLKSITTAQQIGDLEGAFTFTLWLANGMSVNGMADGALKQLAKADQLAKGSGLESIPLALTIAHIRAIANLPEEQRRSHLDEANRLYAKALRVAEEDTVPGAQIELLTQHGKLALATGDRTEAKRSFIRAIVVARKSGLPSLEVESIMALAELHLSNKEPGKAKRILNRSIMAAHETPDRLDLPRYIGIRADTAAALGQTQKADQLYERATTDLEGLLINAPSSRVKAAMLAVYGHIYVGHFRLALEQLHDNERAFQIIERARGRVLLDSLRYPRRVAGASGSSGAVIQITALQRKLLQTQLTNAEARTVLASLDTAYDQMGAAASEQNGQDVKVLRGAPVSLSAFSRTLEPGTVFVEYILDQDASFAFEVSSTGKAEVHRLPAKAQIEKLVISYLANLKSKGDSTEIAEALFTTLLRPVLHPDCRSIVLVPDGALHLLPFQSLQDERKRFVVEQVATSSAPSATVLMAIRNLDQLSAPAMFLGLAYSAAGAGDFSSSRDLAELRGADIKPLQFSDEEIMQADTALGHKGILLKGMHASESDLKEQNLASFRVIHIAAHAFGDQIEPDRAGIVLYPGAKTEDGLWQAREIRATRLRADLVVLSACETGTGRLVGEEGIMNLARAFLAAGARSVIASQWDVDDRATATLMESFYRQFATGRTVQEALRLAQIEFIKGYGAKATPYYWAGFTVFGDGRRTVSATPNRTEQKTARTDF